MLGHDGIHNKMNMNFDINGRSEQHIQFSDVASGGAAVLMTNEGELISCHVMVTLAVICISFFF